MGMQLTAGQKQSYADDGLLSPPDELKPPNRGFNLTIEQRLGQLEKRNKRLTVALTMMAVTICAVVTMAATERKRGDFDIVTVRYRRGWRGTACSV